MRRVQTLEFEDLAGFPAWIRISITNVIVVLSRLIGVPQTLAALVAGALKRGDLNHIVDIGSGSGGSMPEVLALVRQDPGLPDAQLTMTDLYPNPDNLQKFNQPDTPHIRYLVDPVNAVDLTSAPDGLKTMVNSFHHMPPEKAGAILKSAQDNRQPLLIYEMGENMVPFWLWVLLLPLSLTITLLMALVLTLFVRPLTARQLVFTYLIPVIPVFYAWDGQASMPRIYTPDDLDLLLADLEPTADYRWEKGAAHTPAGRKLGSYLLGMPT
jgi:hypothetical protein